MADKFIYVDRATGLRKEKEGLQTSSGINDSGRIPALDATGKLNSSLMQFAKDSNIYGFVPGIPDTIISFNPLTVTFTLAPTGSIFTYYRQGKKIDVDSAKTVILPGSPPSAGLWFIYINDDLGSLTATQTPWSIIESFTGVFVSILEFNSNLTPNYILYDERHPWDLSRGEHSREHYTTGSKLASGGTIFGEWLLGWSNNDNRFGVDETIFFDETLRHTIPQFSDPTGAAVYKIRYRSGSAWNWQLSSVPYLYSTYINRDVNGVLTEGSSGKYYTSYLLVTSAGFQIILGQFEYGTLATAQEEQFNNLTLIGLPLIEFVAIQKFIWFAESSNAQFGKVRIEFIEKINDNSIQTSSFSNHASTHSAGSIDPVSINSTQITDLNTIFVLANGKLGGQTVYGGSAVSDLLKLIATSGIGDSSGVGIEFAVGSNGAISAIKILNNGNVGIGKSPSVKLDVNGELKHTGLSPTSGTNIDQIISYTKSLTLTKDWQDTGIKYTDLATGTYVVQLLANDISAGGSNNNEYYSGIMSWFANDTDSGVEMPTDEIVLHRAGGSKELTTTIYSNLYLRTFRTETGTPDRLKLQIYSSENNPFASNYVFKFRRII
jgi:hypothetical protein